MKVLSGKEAIEKVTNKKYKLIFMDVNMPVMNGIETTKEIISKHKNSVIIGLTGDITWENEEKCKKAGMFRISIILFKFSWQTCKQKYIDRVNY